MACFFKKICLGFWLAMMFFPMVSWTASETLIEEFNPICWEKQACIDVRKELGASTPENGFMPNNSPCLKEGWGKCLPAGQTETTISFGGKRQFTDLGDYLKTVYNYSLIIAGILAVVVIIISGVQWAVSGGSSEAIGSAKKRITGALVGLTIAYLSYVILNTINPNLVNLRLPQVYLIRPGVLATEFCADLPVNNKLALAGGVTDDTSDADKKSAYTKVGDFNLTPGYNLTCGENYFISGSNGTTCKGDWCAGETLCTDINLESLSEKAGKKYKCENGKVAGRVYSSSVFSSEGGNLAGCVVGMVPFINTQGAGEGWEMPWVQGKAAIRSYVSGLGAVCKDGTKEVIKGTVNTVDGDKETFYLINNITNSEITDMVKDCDDSGGLKGFLVFLTLNETCDLIDESHAFGKGGIDMGYVSMPTFLAPTLGVIDFLTEGDSTFNFTTIANRQTARLKSEYFFSAEEVMKGIRLDIDVSKVQDVDTKEDSKVYEKLMN